MPSTLILIPFALVIGVGVMFLWMMRREVRGLRQQRLTGEGWPPSTPVLLENPRAWLAVKSEDLRAIAGALNLHHVGPCSWADAPQRAEDRVFISPPVDGWVLVFGASLPAPEDDVDRFYRFLMDLSRETGLVVYFSADPIFHHHAWVKALNGRVVRAYAWADEVLWNQGDLTQAERDLHVFCLPYHPANGAPSPRVREQARLNCERVPAIAARWSVEPRAIDATAAGHRPGIVGEFTHPKHH
jgi:hypothetical protein